MAGQLYIAPLPEMPLPLQHFDNDAFRFVSKTTGVSQFWKETEERDRVAQSPGIQHAPLASAHLPKTLEICAGSVARSLLGQYKNALFRRDVILRV